ncbi:MAG: DUF2974 domain-containing protein [Clostridia bacterium]|nr:DUF2974 domain-containing protein [Clostridia bacterium]
MANIIDYIAWRGDIPVAQVPIGEVDALVLSYLSYMPYEQIADGACAGAGVTLREAAQALLERGLFSLAMMESTRMDRLLLEAVAGSVRFGAMRVCGYVSHVDDAAEQQFSAVTFIPESGPAFIAFRGTDNTVVGWKEDFNMAFSGEVPSQREAAAYLERAAQEHDGRFILGGHSKGGSLAAYAAVFAVPDVKARVEEVYNFDGPGFNEAVFASQEFDEVDARIHTFVPQTSVVGILLWHAEPFIVVRSDGVGPLQHNPYTWQLMGGSFIRVSERSSSSRLAEETIKRWLAGLAPQKRRQVIDGIYAVLSASDGDDVASLFEPRNILAILRALGDMDEETKTTITDAFRALGTSLVETVPGFVDRAAEEIRQRTRRERTGQESSPPGTTNG